MITCDDDSLVPERRGGGNVSKGLRPSRAPGENPETVARALTGRWSIRLPGPEQTPSRGRAVTEPHLSMGDVSKVRVFCGRMRANGTSKADAALPLQLSFVGPGNRKGEAQVTPWGEIKHHVRSSSCLLSTEREGTWKRNIHLEELGSHLDLRQVGAGSGRLLRCSGEGLCIGAVLFPWKLGDFSPGHSTSRCCLH